MEKKAALLQRFCFENDGGDRRGDADIANAIRERYTINIGVRYFISPHDVSVTLFRVLSPLRSPLGGDVVFQKHATQRLDARRVPVEHRV
jgi:hypothetical protein